jgi:hypothetical protein
VAKTQQIEIARPFAICYNDPVAMFHNNIAAPLPHNANRQRKQRSGAGPGT